jgi:chlorinating enzyme
MTVGRADENEISFPKRNFFPVDEMPAVSFEDEENFQEIVVMQPGKTGFIDLADGDVANVPRAQKWLQAKMAHQYSVYFNQHGGGRVKDFLLLSGMATITPPRLSSEQVQNYQHDGYLVYRDQVFAPEKFAGLKSYFEKLLDALPSGVRPESMDVPHFAHTELFRWLFDDQVLDLVEPILGPDIALFSSHFICKPKGNGKRVPWHEDSSYWRDMIHPMDVCTVWLAIDPSRLENGCMQVIPQTHSTGKLGFSDYGEVDSTRNVFDTEIVKSQRDESKAVALELEPGQASLHDGRIMHGSESNTSSLRRCGYTMRYMSTRTRFNHEKHGQFHKIYLARGKDHAGNTYGDPARNHQDIVELRAKHGKSGH